MQFRIAFKNMLYSISGLHQQLSQSLTFTKIGASRLSRQVIYSKGKKSKPLNPNVVNNLLSRLVIQTGLYFSQGPLTRERI